MSFLYFLIFLIASAIFFTIPGFYLVNKINHQFSLIEKLYLSTFLGFVIFTIFSYLLLLIRVEILLIPTILLINFFIIKPYFPFPTPHFQLKALNFSKKTILILSVFIIGVVGQLAIIAPSGQSIDGDLIFYSAHGHDGMWHIALMEEIKKSFPLQNPTFAGEKLVNYHFFSDIALAMFSKYLFLSNLDLYFRFFPLLFSILLGMAVYFLGKKMTGSWMVGLWATIFTYFAGSFGYIVTWIQNKTIGGESIFYGTQIQSSSGNPPQIISNIAVLTIFYILYLLLSANKGNFWLYLALIIIIGTLVEFKVYAAVVIFISLGLASFWQVIKERKTNLLSLTILGGILSAFLYFPNSKASISFLIFEPWWYIRTMIVTPSRLDLLDWELRRQTYISEGNLKRVVQLEVTAFLIFFFGNLGTRFLGLWNFATAARSYFSNYFNQIFLTTTLVSITAPLLFLQRGVASNTSQFLQYFILLFGILSAITTTSILNILRHSILKIIFSVLIMLLMIPTQLALIYDFYDSPPLAKISSQELAALEFLKENSQSENIILTPPYNKHLDLAGETPDIWDWFDTAYISALTSRRTYLSDFEQVDIMGYDLKSRATKVQSIFDEVNPDRFSQLLKSSGVNYLYYPLAQSPKVDLSKTDLTKFFSNEKVAIWKIPQ